MTDKKATLTINDSEAPIELGVLTPTLGPDVLDVRALQDARADLRVLAHLQPLLVGEGGRLAQDGVQDPHLAQVVQEPREPDALHARRREAELLRQRLRDAPHRARVLGGAGVAGLWRRAVRRGAGKVRVEGAKYRVAIDGTKGVLKSFKDARRRAKV